MSNLLMDSLFMKMVSLSVSGSAVALLLFLLRPLIQNRVPRAWQYYSWLIVVIRMTVPFAHETCLMNHAFQHAPVPVQTHRVIGSLWLTLAAVFLMKKIISHHIYVCHIKRRSRPITDSAVIKVYRRACREARIKEPPEMDVSRAVRSPMVIGFCKPRIVLPEKMLSAPDVLRFVFLHELTHHRRRDFLYKWLVQIVVCLHFFNPLIYLIQKRIGMDCEFSCDAAVIRRLDRQGQRAYGSALISSLEGGVPGRHHSNALMLCSGAKQIKRRLKAIAAYRKTPAAAVLPLLLLTVTVFIFAVYAGAYRIYPDYDGIHSVKDAIGAWLAA